MLEVLSALYEIINLLWNVLRFTYVVSYLIGKYIYNFIAYLVATLAVCINGICIFFEELENFAQEQYNNLNYLLLSTPNIIHSGLDSVYTAVASTGMRVGESIQNGQNQIIASVLSIGALLADALGLIGGSLFEIGDFICYVLTALPKSVGFFFICGLEKVIAGVGIAIQHVLLIGRTIFRDIFHYTLFMALIFLFLTFRKSIIRFLRIRANNFLRARRERRRRIRERSVDPSPTVSPRKPPFIDSISCIICHDQPKSVLLLPCKHLCMCNECAQRLASMQMFCPLCRSAVYKTLTVYI